MFRRVLTHSLILTLAVGPLLCCCTTGRLLASTVARRTDPPSAPGSPADPAPKVTHSCCAHKHKQAEPTHERGPSDHKPADTPKPGEKCPCKDRAGAAEKIQTEVTSADTQTLLRVLTADLLVPSAVVEGSAIPTPSRSGSSPRGANTSLPSTADLLYAHHNLRC